MVMVCNVFTFNGNMFDSHVQCNTSINMRKQILEMTQSCFLGRALGSYLAVHAILMLSLACGVDTNVAVGTALLAWTFLPFWILTLDQKSENGGILGINDNVQR